MMTMLGRRAKDKPTSSELRSILKGLGNSLQAHLERMGQGVAESAQFHQQISDGAETQSRAVIKTTTYLEQLSTTIDSVSNNADSAQSVLRQTENTAQSALGLLEELNKGIRIIRSESHSSEKNMRALCDPTRQISAIVDSIGDIASRTDLLALNASIEAIRAGEHGRGFSLVADEVRSLAEQAAEATREINSLLASIQLVTQESLRGILREREHVEASVSRIEQAEQSLRDIGRLGQEVRSIEQISESAVRQLHLTQSVVEAVEQISVQAKSTRSHADSAGWTMKSLTNGTPQVIGMVERLQQCGRPSQEESYPPEETRDVFDPQRQLQSVS
jgi:methyl-accepting chemotaxis protein